MSKPQTATAKFLEGSIPKHVMTMTLSSTVGLIGIFMVDLLDMFYLSMLGQEELAAAIGFAGLISFFNISFCIGMSITTGIVTARTLGQKKPDLARSLFSTFHAIAIMLSILIMVLIFPFLQWLLVQVGAKGPTLDFASSYLWIVVPTLPFLASTMCANSGLRSLGEAKLAMYATLSGSLVNAVLDPILIFGFDMGIEGAAWATVVARIVMMIVAIRLLVKTHDFFVKVNLDLILKHSREFFSISIPAILTNLATPIGNAYIVSTVAIYGASAVAGYAIVGRIVPIAFAIVFALSGSIGPIVGQNFGAKVYDRIEQTINFSYLLTAVYSIVMWGLLWLLSPLIVELFSATGDAEVLLSLFLQFTSVMFLFTGITFVSNAVFNNLGNPKYSTVMNWSKATIGTIPFIYLGNQYYGLEGILYGQAAGNFVFGVIAFVSIKIYVARKKGV
ncbi:MAG: MATE family efflux transporter [Algicola sp.]|nr:MATE family efflux transporter [Algicola sp.]